MKKIIASVLVVLLFITSLSGCKTKPKQVIDPEKYSFVNLDWTRSTDSCTETIYFKDNGECGYYCACGNPVNDDDLCEGFTFNEKTQTIHLNFSETTAETITKIVVKSFDDKSLVLDFDGDIREFKIAKKSGESVPNLPGDEISYYDEDYIYLEFPGDIFLYDLAESVEYEEDEFLPLTHNKWKFVYYNGDIFVLKSQLAEATAYYHDDKNYKWSVVVETNEDAVICPVTLSSKEISYIYNMENAKRETTLAFDDIEIFATLKKTSNDGFISASTSLAGFKNNWYWRSEIIDEKTKGWPEFVVLLPENLQKQIDAFNSTAKK